jgi:nucleotide-binding universal stress UspA family protein
MVACQTRRKVNVATLGGTVMFSNVLVGVNGEEGGRDAIALARTLLAADGELSVAYVFGSQPHELRGWNGPPMSDSGERAREVLEGACAEAGIEARVCWRAASSVGRGLHELADIIGADLLVVGSSRRGLLGRVRLGDHTRAALNGAPCAVAVAPAGYSSEPAPVTREIGVGYDGSPESDHAVRFARTLAAEFGSKLSAFEAVSIPAYTYLAVDAGSIDDIVRTRRARIATLGGVEPHAAYGDPVEELTLYSASLDLLVVGSRSYGPLRRLVLGSTAQHLARTARCPLLVLTRSARTALAGGESQEQREIAYARAD